MKKFNFLVVLFAATVGMAVQAEPGLLPLNTEEMRVLKLDSIPPWPAEMVLKGTNEHWQKELHRGEVTVTLYEAIPAVLDISEPSPYDEFVLVLEGQVTLTSTDGEKQTYKTGETFLVPKGWVGT